MVCSIIGAIYRSPFGLLSLGFWRLPKGIAKPVPINCDSDNRAFRKSRARQRPAACPVRTCYEHYPEQFKRHEWVKRGEHVSIGSS